MRPKTGSFLVIIAILILNSVWLHAETTAEPEAAGVETQNAEAAATPSESPAPAAEVQLMPQPVIPPADETSADSTKDSEAVSLPDKQISAAEQSATCSNSCESYCSCWKKKGGGGPVMLLIFNRYNSAKYGDFSGPTLWYGGRGYGYIFDNRIRLGGMGAGGAGPADDSDFLSKSSDSIYFPLSKSRQVSGGYGGFTAEYVFSRGKYLEFPMGALIGFGYGGYNAELEQKNVFADNVTTTYSEDGPFIALQPMVGVEANALQWLKIQLTASYLFAKPFDDTKHLGGFTMVFGLMFGHFWPDEWKMPEEANEPEKMAE